jgi:hypothetical protein
MTTCTDSSNCRVGAAPTASPVDTTGGNISYPSGELEWASLLASERLSLAKRRIKPRAVNKAIKEVRYRR